MKVKKLKPRELYLCDYACMNTW